MSDDLWRHTNDLENLVLDAVRQLLVTMPAQMGPIEIDDALTIVYHVQAAREWRARGGTMLAYMLWRANLERETACATGQPVRESE